MLIYFRGAWLSGPFIRETIRLYASGLVREWKGQRPQRERISGSGGFLGVRRHPAQPVFQENFAGAEWAPCQTSFSRPSSRRCTRKPRGFGSLFEVSADRKLFGSRGDAQPGFNLQPGQTYKARFQIWSGPKIYHDCPS